MTHNEFIEKKRKIEKRRSEAFKKLHRCDKDLHKLEEEFMISYAGLKKGDRFILTDDKGNIEYFKIKSLSGHSGPGIPYILVTFAHANEQWKVPRKWGLDNEWEVCHYSGNNWNIPDNLQLSKVTDGTTDKEK